MPFPCRVRHPAQLHQSAAWPWRACARTPAPRFSTLRARWGATWQPGARDRGIRNRHRTRAAAQDNTAGRRRAAAEAELGRAARAAGAPARTHRPFRSRSRCGCLRVLPAHASSAPAPSWRWRSGAPSRAATAGPCPPPRWPAGWAAANVPASASRVSTRAAFCSTAGPACKASRHRCSRACPGRRVARHRRHRRPPAWAGRQCRAPGHRHLAPLPQPPRPDLPPGADARAARRSRTRLAAFAGGVARIQEVVGGHFAPAQGGDAFTSAAVGPCTARIARRSGPGDRPRPEFLRPTGFGFAPSAGPRQLVSAASCCRRRRPCSACASSAAATAAPWSASDRPGNFPTSPASAPWNDPTSCITCSPRAGRWAVRHQHGGRRRLLPDHRAVLRSRARRGDRLTQDAIFSRGPRAWRARACSSAGATPCWPPTCWRSRSRRWSSPFVVSVMADPAVRTRRRPRWWPAGA